MSKAPPSSSGECSPEASQPLPGTGVFAGAPGSPERAEALAIDAHAGQWRRNGQPYITHPQAVALLTRWLSGGDGRAVAVAWLHDVLEDTDRGLDYLRAHGFDEGQCVAVDHLTKPEWVQTDDEYLRWVSGLAQNSLARVVKVADIAHNLTDHDPSADRNKLRRRRRKYYRALLRLLAPQWYTRR